MSATPSAQLGNIRRHQPEGAQARQERLLTCAISVVGELGMRGLTHRALDRAAELPEGTCSVYYRTRLALLTALTEFVATRLNDDVKALAAGLPEPSHAERKVIGIQATIELLQRWSERPDLIITISELGLEAARTPSLRGPMVAWRERLTGMVEEIVGADGAPDAAPRAEAIVACLDGIVLSSLLTVVPAKRAEYLRSVVELVLGNLMDDRTCS